MAKERKTLEDWELSPEKSQRSLTDCKGTRNSPRADACTRTHTPHEWGRAGYLPGSYLGDESEPGMGTEEPWDKIY